MAGRGLGAAIVSALQLEQKMRQDTKIRLAQFFIYALVGAVSFLIELGTFQLLLLAHCNLIASSVLSFLLANAANYFISLKVAFVGGRFTLGAELSRLGVVVAIGLALNTLIVVGLVRGLDAVPPFAKILALPAVLVWNFIGRSLLVFHPAKLPPAIVSAFFKDE